MKKNIGIVGGVGPYAGIDINKKILENTNADTDQKNVDVFLVSRPRRIADRTAFILGESDENPAYEVFNTIQLLEKIGADVIGIPCNTCHSPPIYDKIQELMNEHHCQVKLVHLIEEVYNYFLDHCKGVDKVGVLCSGGTRAANIYKTIFERDNKYNIIYPSMEMQGKVHEAIYIIKSNTTKDYGKARLLLQQAIDDVNAKGVEIIIMGCSEIPLVLKEEEVGIPLVDPNKILARRLIAEVDVALLREEQ